MRLTKMLGLATMAAVAAMAFLGASSAMAESTTLCAEHPALTCPEGHEISEFSFSAKTTTLVTSLATVLCLKSSGKAAVEGALLASPLNALVSSLAFEECGLASGGAAHSNCEVTVNQQPLIETSKTGLNTGTATVNPALPAKVHVKCGSTIDCEYSEPKAGKAFEVKGAEGATPAMLTANELEVEKLPGGFLCPKVSKWTALYELYKARTELYILE